MIIKVGYHHIAYKCLASVLFALILFAFPLQKAQAQETGNFCVQDYQSGARCTANDVRIEQLRVVQVVKGCDVAPTGVLDVVFEALISAAGSPNRYDIGLFLTLNGTSALTGDSCYHDFLPPPITTSPTYGDYNSDGILDIYNGPWWNGESGSPADTCGDIASNTQVFRVLQQIRIACVDGDGNGAADVHVCASWDNNTSSDCSAVQQAYPGTGSKCSCSYINFDFTPTSVELFGLSAQNSATSVLWISGVVFALLAASVALSLYLRRQARLVTIK